MLNDESLPQAELEQLCASLGKEVSIDRIESELQQLWDRDEAATRASLMNFAIYSENPGALLENTHLIAEITRENACRALLVMRLPDRVGDRGAAREHRAVRAWITAHCRLDPNGKKAACSEQVAILVESDNPDLVRSIVFSHLDSDLPLVFWWQGEFTPRFEERLYSRIDRLIVDSASWGDPSQSLTRLCAAMQSEGCRFFVHDLAWTRSFPLRVALATAFDDPAALENLPAVSSVKIEAAPGQETAALLLLAWLATLSEWHFLPAAAENHIFRYRNREQDREIDARIEISENAAPLSLLQVNGSGIAIAIRRARGSEFLNCEFGAGERTLRQILPAGSDSPAGLVSAQLMRGGDNRLFLKVLPQFAQLVAAWQSRDQT